MSADHIKIDEQSAAEEKKEGETSKEGQAEVFLPTSVFYNPVQEFNRDLTIAVISQYAREHFKKLNSKSKPVKDEPAKEAKEDDEGVSVEINEPEDLGIEAGKKYNNGIRVLEGLAASGLRSVRFALEIPGLKEVVTNDFSRTAVEFIKKNTAHNNVEHIITPNHGDAAMVMYQNRKPENQFDIIDLDPYGSPALFLDSAVQSVKDGGILCVTCTDMAILCGNHPETCYAKYGSVSLRSKFCHEMALRIVLHSIEQHANRYSRYIVPIIAVSVDFYVRVFVKVFTGQHKVKQSLSKQAMVYQCMGCGAFALQSMGLQTQTKGKSFTVNPSKGPPVGQKCSHCGLGHRLGGPMWADIMHDSEFINGIIQAVHRDTAKFGTAGRIVGMLSVIKEEIAEVPLYYIMDEMCSVLHCTSPSLLQLRSAILHAGYKVSLSHAAKNSIKTTAPVKVLWDILRCWVALHPVKPHHLKQGTPVKGLLSVSPEIEANFEIHPEANPQSRERGLLRWQINPDKNWGPAARACQGNKVSLEDRRLKGTQKATKRKVQTRDESFFKQFTCKKFKEGCCDQGEKCKYTHSTTSLSDKSSEQSAQDKLETETKDKQKENNGQNTTNEENMDME